MSVFRVQHNKNYTVVNNTIITDSRISWKAKGIWLYAFSRPDDWTFYLKDIIKNGADGRDSVRAGLKELEECGYLTRSQSRNEDGTFSSECEWVFYETPRTDKSEPKTDFPTSENAKSGNRPLLSTENILSTEEQQIVCVGAAPPTSKDGVLQSRCRKKHPDGHHFEVSLEEVISWCITNKKNFPIDLIHEAWGKLCSTDRMVRDPFHFISGTAENIRKMHGLKKLNPQKEKKCHSKNTTQSPQQRSQIEKPVKHNCVSLVGVMKERALARSALKNQQPQNSAGT